MYIYEADAVAVSGEITRPIKTLIPSQAAVSLASIGGRGSAQVTNGSFGGGMLSFRQAQALVTGSYDAKARAYSTMTSAVIEKLNILDVVTADRIVSRLSAVHYVNEPEPHIATTGSYFENLRIAGQAVELTLTNTFNEYDTFAEFEKASANSNFSHDLDQWLVGNKLSDWQSHEHPYLQEIRGYKTSARERHDVYWVSLANHLQLHSEGGGVRNYGSIVVVPNFGIIHLAEMWIQKSTRRLNMLRLQLGSPVTGTVAAGSTFCGGLAGDPTTKEGGPREPVTEIT